ncbi:cell cycle protein GpsB [Firmicutes bacterium CAG:884]|jgi:DivIVA domain-containing protein|nr:cell division regulator GpsB [Bacillota bacterium]CCY94496.1 cell cycle protein GpsB [Firmicutes bacterium CAG:884]
MYQDRILLTSKDIYEKEFKVDTRGYRPQEVDKFLDDIMRDYEEWNKIVSELEEEKKEQLEEIIKLKQEIRYLKTQLDVVKDGKNEGSINNTDLLRRISNLEKVIYGKEE